MNARDLRSAVMHARLSSIRELLSDLDRLGAPTAEELTDNRFHRLVAERVISAMCDLAVGINAHLCAVHGLAVPAGAAATFDTMAEIGVLDGPLARALRRSVGMRNVIVHEYATIDLAILSAAIPLARQQYALYVAAVAGWLHDHA